jgi:hypothetical protein
MFTKLNRVLLASGLAIASAALLSPSAFANPPAGTTSNSGSVTVTGTVQPYTLITVTDGNKNFNIDYDTAVDDQPIATVTYITNVQGVWTINAVGDSTTPGTLETDGADGITAVIPYTVKLGAGADITPGTAISTVTTNTLATGTVSTAIVEQTTPVTLSLKIAASATHVPTKPTTAYSEVITLHFTSDQ